DSETREPTIEIAHEALIRGWGRLRNWLDQNRNDIRLQRMLANAEADWRRADHDKSYLLGGARLVQVDEWSKNSKLALSYEEQIFLDASRAEYSQQKSIEAQRQAHELALERRARRRLQLIVAILVVASIAGIILTLFIYTQGLAAARDRDKAV